MLLWLLMQRQFCLHSSQWSPPPPLSTGLHSRGTAPFAIDSMRREGWKESSQAWQQGGTLMEAVPDSIRQAPLRCVSAMGSVHLSPGSLGEPLVTVGVNPDYGGHPDLWAPVDSGKHFHESL